MSRTADISVKMALAIVVCVLAAAAIVGPETVGVATAAQIESVRSPAVAGAFYPADKTALERFVKGSLEKASKQHSSLPIKAILAPHAGYFYCGSTLAAAYKQIEGEAFTYDRVILIGPSHRVPTRAAAVSSAKAWQTPLGTIPVDTAAARAFAQTSDRIEVNDLAHAMEHSLEVQLPYLVVAAGGKRFEIVPIVTNSSNPADHEIVARALGSLAAGPKTLIVISSDLTHFPTGEVAQKVDKAILQAVASLSAPKLTEENSRLLKGHPGLDCTMCGLDAALCVVRAAPHLGIREAKTVSYTHSGMVTGDSRRVVGYGAMVFLGKAEGASAPDKQATTLTFGEGARTELLSIARSAVKDAVSGQKVEAGSSSTPDLQVKAGCFVTLKTEGKLRGCIGRFQSDQPLWKTVREIAVASATQDYRFANQPILPQEVPQLEVEISVLSPMQKVTKPLQEVKLGRDGITILDKGRSGTFLPQVATETGWSLEEFLGHCSRDKAGLGWDGWKSPTAAVYTYTATIIADEKQKAQTGR